VRLALLISLLIPYWLLAQPPTDRYSTELFEVTETNGIQFSTAVPQPTPGGGFYEFITGLPVNADETDTEDINLFMNIFEPTGDTLSQRPLVIVSFGGGFLDGSKDHWSIRLLCQDLAKRGFVAAAIDYRLGMNIFDSDLANRAVYRGIQDGRSAVRFFRSDAAGANQYRISPDHIYIGGHSSGAFIALHNAYLDKESERPLSTFEWTQDGEVIPDLDCLDCVGDNQEMDGHADAVFGLAGALGFTSFIESGSDPSVVNFHSTDDGTVPYDSGDPFSNISWLVIGSDLPTVYGSAEIAARGDEVGLNHEFYSYSNRGHGVHEDGSSALYDDIVPAIAEWFLDEEMAPQYELTGDSIVCQSDLTTQFSLAGSGGVYFDWMVDGGEILTTDSTSAEIIDIEWQTGQNNYEVMVSPYSPLDAKGAALQLNVQVLADAHNLYIGDSGNWNDAAKWSLNHTPTTCEDVTLSGTGDPVSIAINDDVFVNSLLINSTITLTNNAMIDINQRINFDSRRPMSNYGTVINESTLIVHPKLQSQQSQLYQGSTLINRGSIIID